MDTTPPTSFGDTQPDDVRFSDAALMLGEWLGGSILPGIEDALKQLGAERWAPGTRETVLLAAGHAAVELFGSGEALRPATIEALRQESIDGLAKFVIAQSRMTVLLQRARAATADA